MFLFYKDMPYLFNVKKIALLIFAILLRIVAIAQKITPEPILQTGISANMNVQFKFGLCRTA